MRRKLNFGFVCWIAATVFLSVGPGDGCTSGNQNFRTAASLVADADTLAASSVSSHLEVPIVDAKNVLWCATFQLAWNEARTLGGGKLRFRPPENPMVAILNQHSVSATDLDADSYVAVAGYVRDGIYQRIDRLMRDKFKGAAQPRLLPEPRLASRPQDMVAYCYLFKQLDFPIPFERPDSPLDFAGTNVASFGMEPYKPGHEQMAKGLSILDYQGPDDFIIELRIKSAMDHLVLAKVLPSPTLATTIIKVEQRIKIGRPVPAVPSDILAIPKMNFDIGRHYKELVGQQLIATAPGMPDNGVILAADQYVRFLMDEKGVQLRSESNMSIGCSVPNRPQPVHELVFNKPFLLMLSREGGKAPYFALWIGNAELLEKVKN